MKHLLFVLFIILYSLSSAEAQNLDYRILRKVNHIDNSFVYHTSNFLSNSTPYVSVGIPMAIGIYSLIAKDNDKFLDAFYIGSSLLESVVIGYGIKWAVQRTRPPYKYDDIIVRESLDDHSFPSLHTSAAFSVATSLSIRYPKWYIIAPSMLWATGVGISRLYEGVHYPSDVLCGAILGAGSAWLNHKLNQWLIQKYEPKKYLF